MINGRATFCGALPVGGRSGCFSNVRRFAVADLLLLLVLLVIFSPQATSKPDHTCCLLPFHKLLPSCQWKGYCVRQELSRCGTYMAWRKERTSDQHGIN
ncbi:hypothetical protein B0T24DRAFT_629157 [Lasiosphaeria ovina]|uniref:Secreted protein n=1 Tax=Lasiosphaeria ovina TaxID=92902 RepID=A0AAE0K8G5_9PEZI|nr:hypothetical protein B0T24DRAFT_629157 [Lasiosphaeria ovina]